VANIRIGRLAEGAWRYLNEAEKKGLLKDIDKNTKAAPKPW